MAGKTLRLLTHQFRLPLRHPFTISRASISQQPTLIVELTDGQHRGFGEATTNDYYGMTMSRMVRALEQVRKLVESTNQLDPPLLWQYASRNSATNHSPYALSIRQRMICGESNREHPSTSCGDSAPTVCPNRILRLASTPSNKWWRN